jgi:uncharacterized protein (TIGR03089 family)
VTSVRAVVQSLSAGASARPRLTWYAGAGERVELSGRVVGNWLAKATNLLLEEAAAGPGARIVVDLPAHWRCLVWASAAWTTGAEVVLRPGPGGGVPPDPRDGAVLVTDRPDGAHAATGLVVAVPLAPLATRWPGPLPAGTLDGAADLMVQPDAVGLLPRLDPDAPALVPHPGEVVSHAQLCDWAARTAGAAAWPPQARVLVATGAPLDLVAVATAAWARDGSVVVTGPGAPHADVVAGQERVNVRA